MAKVKINGLEIAYEIIGSGTQTIAITCGGRFSKDAPGLRELAQKLAEAGYKVLIWDRIKAKWHLSATPTEWKTLVAMAATC